eukprot:gb/GECG01009116.1/.p1 GENE.gb/GECG01009116.1/~~gb/GECG01009116.1/.p1  ORF type:complete len:1050 (+),score=167.73 gb/GECG01009116.1/:1-3150(+)
MKRISDYFKPISSKKSTTSSNPPTTQTSDSPLEPKQHQFSSKQSQEPRKQAAREPLQENKTHNSTPQQARSTSDTRSNEKGVPLPFDGLGHMGAVSQQRQDHPADLHSDIGRQYVVPAAPKNKRHEYVENSKDAIEKTALKYLKKNNRSRKAQHHKAKERPQTQPDDANNAKDSNPEGNKNKSFDLVQPQTNSESNAKRSNEEANNGLVPACSHTHTSENSRTNTSTNTPARTHEKPVRQKEVEKSNTPDQNRTEEPSVRGRTEVPQEPSSRDNNKTPEGKKAEKEGFNSVSKDPGTANEEYTDDGDIILLSDDEEEDEDDSTKKPVEENKGSKAKTGKKVADSVAYTFDNDEGCSQGLCPPNSSNEAVEALNSSSSRRKAAAMVKAWDSVEKAMANRKRYDEQPSSSVSTDTSLEAQNMRKRQRHSNRMQAYKVLNEQVEEKLEKEKKAKEKEFRDTAFSRWFHESIVPHMRKFQSVVFFLCSGRGRLPQCQEKPSKVYFKVSKAIDECLDGLALRFWEELSLNERDVIDQVLTRVQPFHTPVSNCAGIFNGETLNEFCRFMSQSDEEFIKEMHEKENATAFDKLREGCEQYKLHGERVRVLMALAQKVLQSVSLGCSFQVPFKKITVRLTPSAGISKGELADRPKPSNQLAANPIPVKRMSSRLLMTVSWKLTSYLKSIIRPRKRYGETAGADASPLTALEHCRHLLVFPRSTNTSSHLVAKYHGSNRGQLGRTWFQRVQGRLQDCLARTNTEAAESPIHSAEQFADLLWQRSFTPLWLSSWVDSFDEECKSEWSSWQREARLLRPWIKALHDQLNQKGESPDRPTVMLLLNVMALVPDSSIQDNIFDLLQELQQFFPAHLCRRSLPYTSFDFIHAIIEDLATPVSPQSFVLEQSKVDITSLSKRSYDAMNKGTDNFTARIFCLFRGRVMYGEWLVKILWDSVDTPAFSPLWKYLKVGEANEYAHANILLDNIALGLSIKTAELRLNEAGSQPIDGSDKSPLDVEYRNLLHRTKMIFENLMSVVVKLLESRDDLKELCDEHRDSLKL